MNAALRKLASHSAVYGAADVFTNVVNFLLVPVYTTYLTPTDYGHLALLFLFGTVAKIVFRLGLDAGFFRVHYALTNPEEQRRLAGTVALMGGLAGAVLFAVVALFKAPLTRALLGASAPTPAWVVLVAGDIALGAFAFVPLSLLRIQERPALFSTLSAGRHAVNIVLKVLLVVRGHGVTGILWSDLLATGAFSLALLPILLRHASGRLTLPLLKEALRFGLPKVPHGMLVQVLNLADRKILDLYVTRAEVGVYQMGYTVGSGVKFATSAFEPAWGPFVYSRLKDADAPAALARVATYAFAVFLATGLAVGMLGRELLQLLTPRNPAFWPAAPVVPLVALAYVLHGAFLLGSIGIGITRQAAYYPLVTLAAAATNVGLNFALVPRYGILGAAWATVAAYGVMALAGIAVSRRLYPMPFETGRLLRLVAAAAAMALLSTFAPSPLWPALLVKLLILSTFPLLLWAMGFFPRGGAGGATPGAEG